MEHTYSEEEELYEYTNESVSTTKDINDDDSLLNSKQLHKVMYIPKFRNYLHSIWISNLNKKIYMELIELLEFYCEYYNDTEFLCYLDSSEFRRCIDLVYFHIVPKYQYSRILQNKQNIEYLNTFYPLISTNRKSNTYTIVGKSNETYTKQKKYVNNVWIDNKK